MAGPANWTRGAALAAVLFLLPARGVRAQGAVSYKYEDYRENGGRIGVQTRQALVQQNFGPDWSVKVGGLIDAIAGATPDGEPAPAGSDQVPVTLLHDRRKAWNADAAGQFGRINVAAGIANSRESDYVSTGWSLNTLTDFNLRNTTLLAGVAGTNDDVKVFFQPQYRKKRTNDVIAGVTQLLDPATRVAVNLSWGRATGFLSDPYKLVAKNFLVAGGLFLRTFGENRPEAKNKGALLASVNRDFASWHGALEASYRYYHDTDGIEAHTAEVAWLARLGPRWVLEPGARFYLQSAAKYYIYNLDNSAVTPQFGPLPTRGPFYSSDYRLSRLRTTTWGLKLTYRPRPWCALDAGWQYYAMQGRDGVTAGGAYPRAEITTLGGRVSW